jgi:hypothetical protein
MFNAQDIILARQFKPDLSISKLDTESLILLQIMNHARGGGVVPIYDADITNGIASFSGVTKSKPLVSLKLNIPVTQQGSGTPSPDNIRDIVGVQGVNVSRTGKNLFSGQNITERSYITSSGDIKNTGGWNVSDYIPVSANTVYTFTPNTTGGNMAHNAFYDSNKNLLGVSPTSNFTFTTPNNCKFVRLSFRSSSYDIQFEHGNTATPYEPYTGNTYPITFGQTVYSANLDVLTGKLYLIDELKTIDENSLIAMSSTNIGIFAINNFFDEVNDNDSINCDCYQRGLNRSGAGGVFTNNPEGSFCCNSTSKILYIKDTRFTTIEDYKTWLSTNPVKIAVKLAEPIEIDLTPTVINTLIGENVIFADVGDITECKYTRK